MSFLCISFHLSPSLTHWHYRSELAGIEGIVKLKHLDDSNITVSIDTTDSADVINPKTKLTQKNATLPLDAKLNGMHHQQQQHQDYELKR